LIAKYYPSLKPTLQFLRPTGQGVKVVIFYKNKLLFIKNTYRVGWTLPGGGVKKNESPEQAAVREVREEVGISISNLKRRGKVKFDFDKNGAVTVFSCEVKTPDYEIDNLEVEKANWVDFNKVTTLELLPVATRCIQLL
jgi:8-oxo-dGTP pyrophosphatase MutT (NUDIX family)